MTITGIGTDIVEIQRVAQARHLHRLSDFFFVAIEKAAMRKSRDQVQFLASRLAAKESIIKAYPGTLHYHDITLRKKGQKLSAVFNRPQDKKLQAFVSIAHERDYALGYAIVCQ